MLRISPRRKRRKRNMSLSLTYALPFGEESRAAFFLLKDILASAQMTDGGNAIALAAAPDLAPVTIFRLDPCVERAAFFVTGEAGEEKLPDSFFTGEKTQEPTVNFAEAAHRLAGKIRRIDHTGLVVPCQRVPSADWDVAVTMLASRVALYDYPASPEYDPALSRWLFAVPRSAGETLDGDTRLRLRQPKFELVWDARAPYDTILQIDMETTLTRDDILQVFPEGKSYELPGVGAFFRSVSLPSPWPGISSLRLDLRYKDPVDIDDWNSAAWLFRRGRRIKPC